MGWNTDFDPKPDKPTDTHKLTSSAKFILGDYKFNISGSMNTHIFDRQALADLKLRQPTNR